MALGDELVRTSNATPPAGEVPLTPELEENLEVRRLGAQISRGGEAAHNIAEDLQPVQTGASHNLSNEDAGRVARAARAETGGVPEDDARTPPGVAAPSEGKAVGDAIKNFFGAMEQPGAKEALRQMGVEVRPAQQESNVQGETPVQRATGEGQGLPAQPPSDQQLQQAQAAVQAQGQGQGFVGTLGQLLGNRDVQRALISAGSAISGEAGPLAQFGNQLISGQAQEEFQQKLREGMSPGQAASSTEGLTPEGRQSVLSAFRGEEQREFEREQARGAAERGERLTDAQVEEVRAGIRQEDRALDQDATRLAIQQGRLDLAEEQLALEKLNAQAEREATEALGHLRDAQATQTTVGAAGGGRVAQGDLGDIINNTDQVLGRLQDEITFMRDRRRGLNSDIIGVRDKAGRFSGISDERQQELLEQKRRQLRTLNQGIQSLSSSREQLNSELQNITNVMTGQGEGGGEEEGQETSVPSFESFEAARGQVSKGDKFQVNGTTYEAVVQNGQLRPAVVSNGGS